MAVWKKIDRNENSEGITITYRLEGTQILIQSRLRHIPHANGSGTWDHTSYFVLDNGKEVKESWRLSEAKAYAENLAEMRARSESEG